MDEREDSSGQGMSTDHTGDERPLKKARYLWQIKGRYRFRNNQGRCCTQSSQQPYNLSNHSSNQSSSQTPQPSNWSVVMALAGQQDSISQWQTRQMALAMVDNTINEVLDNSDVRPSIENDYITSDMIPPEHNRFIENEAVLMAIQSHGLHKPCICPHSHSTRSTTPNIPFHHRTSPSTSKSQEKFVGETDFLAQAVAVAIQKKGLGSSHET